VAGLFAAARGREEGGKGNGSDPARDHSRARFVLVLLLAWGAVAAVGIAGYYAGRALPAHRFLAFLLPFPIFMALGFLGIGRVAGSVAGRVLGVGRSRAAARTARALGVAVVAVAIVAVAVLGYKNLFGTLNGRGIEFLDGSKIQDATNGQAYLDAVHVPADAPVVFVIDTNGPDPQEFLPEEAHILRTVMSAERIQHAYFYLGTPGNYLAGVQTVKPGNPGNFNVASLRFWNVLQPVLPQHPVALLLADYNPTYATFAAAHPDDRVAFNVLSLGGPRPTEPVASPPFPSVPRSRITFTLLQIAGLVAVTLIGIGWAVALLPVGLRPFEILALSLAFGLAAVVLGALLVDAAGIRLTGAPALLTPVLVAVAGWASGGWRLARRGPAVVGNTYLEGTYSEVYPNISQDEAGLRKLFLQFSFPGGIPSHASPECPGSIHRGWRAGLFAQPFVRGGVRQSRSGRCLHRRRRRGGDWSAGHRVAFQQVPRPNHRRRGAAYPASQRLQDLQPDPARAHHSRRAGTVAARLRLVTHLCRGPRPRADASGDGRGARHGGGTDQKNPAGRSQR